MLGRAVMTTEASSTIIRYVARITPSTRVGCGRAEASGPGSARRARPLVKTGSKTGLSFGPRGSYTEPEESSTCFGGCLRFVSGTIAEVPSALSSPSPKMTTSPTAPPVQLSNRPKRADALRNYERLVAAAREAFTEADRSASLEDIARRAGVGIGTLYRNFPTRSDLVQAVYVDEVEALARSADASAELEPWEGLTTWLQRFVGYVATKQALSAELFAIAERDASVFAAYRGMLHPAGEPLLRRAQDAGIVRSDVSIEEVVRMVAGIAKIPTDDPAEIQRVLSVALDGLRYRPAT